MSALDPLSKVRRIFQGGTRAHPSLLSRASRAPRGGNFRIPAGMIESISDLIEAAKLLPPKPTPKPFVRVTSGSKSKLQICKDIYRINKHLSRADVIKAFITHAQCTPAGASTYYNTCKNG